MQGWLHNMVRSNPGLSHLQQTVQSGHVLKLLGLREEEELAEATDLVLPHQSALPQINQGANLDSQQRYATYKL